MQNLYSLFPADNFTLLAVVVALPLMGAIVNGLFGKRLGKTFVGFVAGERVLVGIIPVLYLFYLVLW